MQRLEECRTVNFEDPNERMERVRLAVDYENINHWFQDVEGSTDAMVVPSRGIIEQAAKLHKVTPKQVLRVWRVKVAKVRSRSPCP